MDDLVDIGNGSGVNAEVLNKYDSEYNKECNSRRSAKMRERNTLEQNPQYSYVHRDGKITKNHIEMFSNKPFRYVFIS